MRVTTSITVLRVVSDHDVDDSSAVGGGGSATDLAKKTQNPVADLISVPFQNNFNFSAGPNDATIYSSTCSR